MTTTADHLLQTPTTGFDYAALDPVARIKVERETGEIRELFRCVGNDIVAIGALLLTVKIRLGHGQFGRWLAAEFNMSERTAQRMMNVSETFDSDTVSDLGLAPTVLYALAAPGVPDSVRSEVVTAAKAGERVTPASVKARVATARAVVAPVVTVPAASVAPAATVDPDSQEGANRRRAFADDIDRREAAADRGLQLAPKPDRNPVTGPVNVVLNRSAKESALTMASRFKIAWLKTFLSELQAHVDRLDRPIPDLSVEEVSGGAK